MASGKGGQVGAVCDPCQLIVASDGEEGSPGSVFCPGCVRRLGGGSLDTVSLARLRERFPGFRLVGGAS